MADYKCDICGKKATVHITKIINGQKFKIHLCEDCAKENPAQIEALVNTQIALGQAQAAPDTVESDGGNAPEKVSAAKKCPNCEAEFSHFEKTGRVSCAYCYEAFADKFDEILMQMHGSNRHCGKTPKVLEKKIPKNLIKNLNEQLGEAIAQERYEDAAVLRDKIKELKSTSQKK